jgi:regulatory factor X 1/2/3
MYFILFLLILSSFNLSLNLLLCLWQKILDAVVALRLNSIESLWKSFWRAPTISTTEIADKNYYDEMLSKEKLVELCKLDQVVEFVKRADYHFYQFCIEILIPDVLSSLPQQLVKSIRDCAKHLDGWLRQALVDIPDKMREAKLVVINTFSITLRRYTSLNHLAYSVRNSLQTEAILANMLVDIAKVEFKAIRVSIPSIDILS